MRIPKTYHAGFFALGVALLLSASTCPGQPAPKGPEAVARQAPNRVVAIIGGKQITAGQAMDMLKLVAPQLRRERESQLPKLVQQLYVQRQIAEEAVKLHLDQKSPWKEQLLKTRMVILQGAMNYRSQPEKDISPERVLSQASTREEKQALVKREKEKYKIQVQDPDFFNGVTS